MKTRLMKQYKWDEPLTTALSSKHPLIDHLKERFDIEQVFDGQVGTVHLYSNKYHYIASLIADTVLFMSRYANVLTKQPWCTPIDTIYRVTK